MPGNAGNRPKLLIGITGTQINDKGRRTGVCVVAGVIEMGICFKKYTNSGAIDQVFDNVVLIDQR